jgi:hypothetical protein
VLTGLVAGLAGNLALARLAPGVSWLWWNPAGFFVACTIALMVGRMAPRLVFARWPGRDGALLVGAFLVMLMILVGTAASVG